MIKGYSNLSNLEKYEVYKFVNRNEDSEKSLDEIDDLFNNKANGYGEGSLFCFIDNKVVGKVSIVLEVCKELGCAYIYSHDILEGFENKELVVIDLTNTAIEIAKKHNPTSIYLCAGNKEHLRILENLGYKGEYVSLSMTLDDKLLREKTLDLIKLSNENKEIYLNIINDSFSDMPHGIYHYITDIEKYINKSDENNHFFMVAKDNNIIGFMNVEIEKDRGLFDIGLCKEYRGKGYGKSLLETAIDFLNKKSVENVELIVIKKNKIAYNMYKNRGFKDKLILGYWMEVK